jgi:glycosyltransferase involved in cell wall biosynthesis
VSQIDLSIVVPVFNNAATLDILLDRILATLDGLGLAFEIVAVDDGSSDASAAILQRRAEADPRIRPRTMTRNFGSQAALCAGFDHARGRRVACIDADLENYPEDLPALLAGLDRGFDLACGVRIERRSPTWRRRLPSQILNAYVRRRLGTQVRDIGCGMRAMDARVVRNLGLEGEARRLLTPLLLRRARSVIEVPIRHAPPPRGGGHSFFSLLGITLDFYLLTARRPFLVAGVISVALLVGGVVTALIAALGTSGTALIAGMVCAGTGFVGTVLSLVGEYAQRIYQLEQGLPFYELRRDENERLARTTAD